MLNWDDTFVVITRRPGTTAGRGGGGSGMVGHGRDWGHLVLAPLELLMRKRTFGQASEETCTAFGSGSSSLRGVCSLRTFRTFSIGNAGAGVGLVRPPACEDGSEATHSKRLVVWAVNERMTWRERITS